MKGPLSDYPIEVSITFLVGVCVGMLLFPLLPVDKSHTPAPKPEQCDERLWQAAYREGASIGWALGVNKYSAETTIGVVDVVLTNKTDIWTNETMRMLRAERLGGSSIKREGQ